MNHVRLSSPLAQVVGLIAIVVITAGWQPSQTNISSTKTTQSVAQDTLVPKRADIDEANLQLNMDSLMQTVNAAIAKIDFAAMNRNVQKAMSQIDYNKINKQVNDAMKTINGAEIKADVTRAIDSAKGAIDKIDWKQINAQTATAQKEARKAIALQKANMDSLNIIIQKAIKEAQRNLKENQ